MNAETLVAVKRIGRMRNWIFCLIAGLLCVLLGLLPTTSSLIKGSGGLPRAQVEIISVDNTNLQPLGVVYAGVQVAQIKIVGGKYDKTQVEAYNFLNSDMEKDKLYKVGERALAMLRMGEDIPISATLIDHYRLPTQALLVALFAALLIILSGVSGCGAMISLIFSVVAVWKLLIPMLMRGWSPLWCSMALVILLTVLIDLLVTGFTRVTAAAILGSLLGTITTCALSFLFGYMLKIDGTSLPYIVPIIAQGFVSLDLRQLFLSMVFIANAGALMDVSMDIASAAGEIVRHSENITRRELLRSCMMMGRNVMGTMTTTLILAYSGSYLSMLMYFMGQGTPLIDVLNLKYISSEILTTLVGSFGLVTVAPFTAVVAASICRGGRRVIASENAAKLS